MTSIRDSTVEAMQTLSVRVFLSSEWHTKLVQTVNRGDKQVIGNVAKESTTSSQAR